MFQASLEENVTLPLTSWNPWPITNQNEAASKNEAGSFRLFSRILFNALPKDSRIPLLPWILLHLFGRGPGIPTRQWQSYIFVQGKMFEAFVSLFFSMETLRRML